MPNLCKLIETDSEDVYDIYDVDISDIQPDYSHDNPKAHELLEKAIDVFTKNDYRAHIAMRTEITSLGNVAVCWFHTKLFNTKVSKENQYDFDKNVHGYLTFECIDAHNALIAEAAENGNKKAQSLIDGTAWKKYGTKCDEQFDDKL